MDTLYKNSQDAKSVFRKCGTCSQTFAHILNCEFGHPKELEEIALGGVLNLGHQCGMLWGTTLAIGAESYRMHKDSEKAIAICILATQHIIDSFLKQTKTINCKEITGYDLSNVIGLVKFTLTTLLKGINNSPCFNLAEQWAPEAIQSAAEGLLQEPTHLTKRPVSCASKVLKRMGASDEEMIMVSGFAGGLGLSGKACGALSAAIWMRTLDWCRKNPGKKEIDKHRK